MAATPQITLNVNLLDISGGAVTNGTVTVTLCNFGPTLPSIQGTAMLARTGPVAYKFPTGSGSITLWGNDVINPVNATYYAITVEDDKKNVVQAGIYQFTGTQTLDLSQAAQISPYIGVPPLQYITADLFQITVPSSVYTLTQDVFGGMLLGLFYNGALQIPGLHYTLNGRTVTLNGWTTGAGDNLYASYVAASVN